MCEQHETDKVLLKDIVGEFHSDDEKIMVDYSAVFRVYQHMLPANWTPMTLAGAADDGKQIPVSAASLCSAGSLLPLAKMVVYMASWLTELNGAASTESCFMSATTQSEQCYEKSIMALAAAKEHEPGKVAHALRNALQAADATGHVLAKTFVVGCATKVCKHFSSLVSLIHKDFESLRAKLINLYEGMEGLSQFEESVAQGQIDSKLTTQLIEGKSLQMCYHVLAYGLPSIQGAQKLLRSIAGATGHADFKDDDSFSAVRKEVHAEIQLFKAFLECEPSALQPVVMSTIASTVGNATIAQSCTRALKTGETRQGLVNRAQAGVKKRGWKIHASLQQRVAQVLNGKTGAK